MAVEDAEQPEMAPKPHPKPKPPQWQIVVMRFLALCATASATIVMALNKETKTIVVALPGNTTVSATVTAKFQQTPAFVIFVAANAIGSFHNLSLLLLQGLLGRKFELKRLELLFTITDMTTVGLLSAGAAGAAAMAELGKNGNSHARWNKICNNFDAYCDRGGLALIASFIAVGLMMVINALSIAKLYKNQVGRW